MPRKEEAPKSRLAPRGQRMRYTSQAARACAAEPKPREVLTVKRFDSTATTVNMRQTSISLARVRFGEEMQ